MGGIAVLLLVVFLVIPAFFKVPKDAGSFSRDDYAHEIEIGAKPTQNVGKIHNRFQACKKGVEIITDTFPITKDRTAWLNPEMTYKVYRDEELQLWLVYILPRDTKWVVGGSYAVILTDDGDIVSCWGER